MEKVINVGFLGCGRVADKHMAAINVVDGIELRAICDPDPSTHRFPVPKGHVHRVLDSFLDDSSFGFVVVMTPSGFHAEHTSRVLYSGGMAIVEKPMCLRGDDAESLVDITRSCGSLVYVVHQYRYKRSICALRDAYLSGRFGKVIGIHARLSWYRPDDYFDGWRGSSLDKGILFNQAAHLFDVLSWIFRPFYSVSAVGRNKKFEFKDAASYDSIGVIIDGEDFNIDVIASVACSSHDLGMELLVLGTEGCAKLTGFTLDELEIWDFEKPLEQDEQIRVSCKQKLPLHNYHIDFYEDLVSSFFDHRAPPIDVWEGARIVSFLEAIDFSIETRKVVILRRRYG